MSNEALAEIKHDVAGRKAVFERTVPFVQRATPWCMGCGYGALARAVIEEIEALKPKKMIATIDTACLEFIEAHLPCDNVHAGHGRAVSVARAVKKVHPDALVVAFQGDGGMLNEGLNEVMHAAAAGESICVIMGNNGVLGDTGGQFTVAAEPGLVTSSSPLGKNPKHQGMPIKIADILATFPTAAYVARGSTHDPAYAYRLQKMIRKAFQAANENAGFVLVDAVTTCPTGWGMTSVEAVRYAEHRIEGYYPVGVLKDWEHGEKVEMPSFISSTQRVEGMKTVPQPTH